MRIFELYIFIIILFLFSLIVDFLQIGNGLSLGVVFIYLFLLKCLLFFCFISILFFV